MIHIKDQMIDHMKIIKHWLVIAWYKKIQQRNEDIVVDLLIILFIGSDIQKIKAKDPGYCYPGLMCINLSL